MAPQMWSLCVLTFGLLLPWSCANSVRYWTGRHGSKDTQSNCDPDFLLQLGLVQSSVDSLGFNAFEPGIVDGKDGTKVVMKLLASQEDIACMQYIKKVYPRISIGLWGGYPECWSSDCVIFQLAKNPGPFIDSVITFVAAHPFIHELWTDFEVKNMHDPLVIRAMNDVHQILTSYVRVYRYAGCVHNHEPAYFNETCKQFHVDAPDVVVQGAGTYWDDSVAGFDSVLFDMVTDIGFHNVQQLSVAVCPFGCGVRNQASQEDLYDRMDLIAKVGSTDVSVFYFDSMFNTTNQTVLNISMTWVNALAYFRTGQRDAGTHNKLHHH